MSERSMQPESCPFQFFSYGKGVEAKLHELFVLTILEPLIVVWMSEFSPKAIRSGF